MKPYRASVCAFLAFITAAALASCAQEDARRTVASSDVLLATFNVHYISPWQERMRWEDRRDAVLAALRDADADIVAFQEMETFEGGRYNEENRQLDWLRPRLSDYSFTAVGDPARYPSTQPIMYRAERFESLEQGFFFFSPTPDEIYSRSWNGGFPAFCSWARLRDREAGATFYLYNVHFDHSSRGNRIKSARLVTRRIAQRAHPENPVIVAGDINAPAFFRTVGILTDAGLKPADPAGSTFHFYTGIDVLPAIDHVLVSEGLEAKGTLVLRDKYDGTWPSDHYPLLAGIDYTGEQATLQGSSRRPDGRRGSSLGRPLPRPDGSSLTRRFPSRRAVSNTPHSPPGSGPGRAD